MTREEVAEIDPEVILLDGHDHALIGLVHRVGQPMFALYDLVKIREHLIEVDKLPPEDADEHISFNVTSVWVGEKSPGFIIQKSVEED